MRESLAASKGSTLKQGAAMYYGFDIGGTKIALGVFDSGRQLQWEKRVP
ncbi:N-acetylglucosamine kinase, partial [Escherichia coli]|nr:N-acetylglucosamine kinase [Escherichia coli]